MTLNELRDFFDTLKLAEKSIGYRKENKKHLVRIEQLRELILEEFDGSSSFYFSKDCTSREFTQWLAENPDIWNTWFRGCNQRCFVPGRPWKRSKDAWGGDGLPGAESVIGWKLNVLDTDNQQTETANCILAEKAI